MLKLNNLLFKKSLIIFWAIWWLIAFWTDLIGGFAHLGLIQASWAPDTNYPNLHASLQMYNLTDWMVDGFYISIVIGCFASFYLFACASLLLNKPKEIWLKKAENAFIFSLLFWLIFFLADQMIMKFDLEANHMIQGGFELLCFMALYVIPNNSETNI